LSKGQKAHKSEITKKKLKKRKHEKALKETSLNSIDKVKEKIEWLNKCWGVRRSWKAKRCFLLNVTYSKFDAEKLLKKIIFHCDVEWFKRCDRWQEEFIDAPVSSLASHTHQIPPLLL
jgi:hypothetical protein